MSQNALISYLGENKPNLISEITSHLTELDGEFSGVTFATLEEFVNLLWFIKQLTKFHLRIFKETSKNKSFLFKRWKIQIKPIPLK